MTADARDLARWSEALAAIARTGLAFTENLYERERYEEVLHVAGDIKAAARKLEAEADADAEAAAVEREIDHFVSEWMDSIGEGVPGYVTPKTAVGAIVGNDDGEILLVQRKDSGIWLYPTGWADVGYSPAEVAVKEVSEETGIECEASGSSVCRRPADGVQPVRDVHAVVPLHGDGWRAHAAPARDGRRRLVLAATRCPRRPPARSGGARWRSPRSTATTCTDSTFDGTSAPASGHADARRRDVSQCGALDAAIAAPDRLTRWSRRNCSTSFISSSGSIGAAEVRSFSSVVVGLVGELLESCEVLDHVVVVADQRGDPSVVFGSGGGERATAAAACRSSSRPGRPSAIAALGDGTCDA